MMQAKNMRDEGWRRMEYETNKIVNNSILNSGFGDEQISIAVHFSELYKRKLIMRVALAT